MNSKEHTADLLPSALCDGRVAVHELSHIECVGSTKFQCHKEWFVIFKFRLIWRFQ